MGKITPAISAGFAFESSIAHFGMIVITVLTSGATLSGIISTQQKTSTYSWVRVPTVFARNAIPTAVSLVVFTDGSRLKLRGSLPVIRGVTD